ncbi:MAG: LegC family aminotransferase [Cyclobacteriaceae bacterium]|nr:LegC family aminotransferase [Cyclobacteriaceae bacterium]MCB0504913.1 LegC family aminotransferase [Cyclobacteriaceae bacterium]MCB9238040.1 LegC family aminotransferase [Flammeovirgaceae bacterium]MCO5272568.1 LegC family aminotransferase [Cyclobacteriaceae bacterium]MCW5901636.1 LegC family aminotransferase [Cyclobacteriaceae bacterium]
MSTTFDKIVSSIRDHYNEPEEFIPLHAPTFEGNEGKYVLEAISSTFVSSVGKFVNEFEDRICSYTGAKFAVATVNGTAGLHMALLVAGVKRGDLVITQPLSFIATCNAISYLGAEPIFVDIDDDTLGLSPEKTRKFLELNCKVKGHSCIHVASGRKIAACVPMHTFGHPVHLCDLVDVCEEFCIPLVEDAAESIGSLYYGKHTGTFGLLGVFSFNGNKTITCGGGGVIVTNDAKLAKLAKHLTTQAKIPHAWKFTHDQIGYNYRLPNLNAAMACAQLEMLDRLLSNKRMLAMEYMDLFQKLNLQFVCEPQGAHSNYWLNSVLFKNREERDSFLMYSNDKRVMTRPVWDLMTELAMFKDCIRMDISSAKLIADRLVNLPSSPIIK